MTTQYIYDLVDTWNNGATTFTAIKMDVTDTASDAASLLMDLQVGAASKFSVSKAGGITTPQLSSTANQSSIAGTIFGTDGNGPTLSSASQLTLRTNSSTTALYLSSAGVSIQGTDIYLTRRGTANLRFGAADAAAAVPQKLSVQSVVAGTSNTAGGDLTITGSQGTGSGAGGSIIFQVAPAGAAPTVQNGLVDALTIFTNEIRLGIGNSSVITIGHTAASSSARIGFFAGAQFVNSTLGGVGAARFTDSSTTAFGGIQFGGTSAAYPALKRNGAGIDIVGADNTNVSFIRVPGVTVASLPSASTAGVGARSFVTDATVAVYASTVAGGGSNKVPVFSDGTNWIIG